MYEQSLLHIFYNIQKYTFKRNFTKRFEIIVTATFGKNLGPPMPKRSNESYLQVNQDLQTTCNLSMICQINVVDKQLVPLLN